MLLYINWSGLWVKNMEGVERILYRLPELLEAKRKGEEIYLVEGEKDSDRLRQGGLTSTTNSEGAAGPWRQQYTDCLKRAHIVLFYDEDVAGHGRRDAILRELYGKVESLKIVPLPGLEFSQNHGADVTDWLAKGHTIQELKLLVGKTPQYELMKASKKDSGNIQKAQLIIPGGAQSIQETARMAGRLLNQTNRFFLRGGVLVEVANENQAERCLNPIKPAQLASEMESFAQVVRNGSKGMEPAILNCAHAQIIRDRAPLMVVEADESQTGKGYFVKIIAAIYGHKPRAITQRKGIGGIEESLNMRLIKGDSFISFDNIRGKIDSPALESLLTEDHYMARVPFMPPIDIDPTRLVLFLTSNQCEMTQDLANRSCSLQLRKQDIEYKFRTFPEGDLMEHVKGNCSLYFGAIASIVNEWVIRGRPQTSESRHDFRKWAQSLDWIVQNLFGMPSLMAEHKETQKRMIHKQLNWIRSIALLILKTRRNNWLRTAMILEQIEDSEFPIPGLKEVECISDDESRKIALTSIGRELGMCFKTSYKILINGQSMDEIAFDDIKVQRRIIKEFRGGISGPTEAKEYRFQSLNYEPIAPEILSSATIAIMPSENVDSKKGEKTDQVLSKHIDRNIDMLNGDSGG